MHPLLHLEQQIQQERERRESQRILTYIYDGKYLIHIESTTESTFKSCIELEHVFNYNNVVWMNFKDADSEGLLANNVYSVAYLIFSRFELPFTPIVITIRASTLGNLLDKYKRFIPKEVIREYAKTHDKDSYQLAVWVENIVEDSIDLATEALDLWLEEDEVNSILYLGFVDVHSKIYPNTFYRVFEKGLTKKIIKSPTLDNEYFYCAQPKTRESLNLYDQVLAKVAALKTDEEEFIKIANLL